MFKIFASTYSVGNIDYNFFSNKNIMLKFFFLISIFSSLVLKAERTPCKECKIENAVAEITVCLAHGRIKVFKRKQGKNVLWINKGSLIFKSHKGWMNYGGNRIWIVPAGMRNVILGKNAPDKAIDGMNYKLINKSKRSITFQSSFSKKTGVFLTRKITFLKGKCEALLENTITRLEKNPFPLHIWMFSQVPLNKKLFINIKKNCYPDIVPYKKLRGSRTLVKISDINENIIQVKFSFREWDVVNSWGEKIYIENNDYAFIQTSSFLPDMPYVEGANISSYSNKNYMEMESISPLIYLKKGESYTNKVKWSILPVLRKQPSFSK